MAVGGHEVDAEVQVLKELPAPREFPCIYEEAIAAMIGPMILVAMQSEVCAPIGRTIKETFSPEHPLMIFAYLGEHNLPTRTLVRENAYQAKVIQIQYALPVGWAEEVEDDMVKGVQKLVLSVLSSHPRPTAITSRERN